MLEKRDVVIRSRLGDGVPDPFKRMLLVVRLDPGAAGSADRIGAWGRMLGAHRADGHDAREGRGCGGLDQLDRSIAVHGELSLRAATGAGTGGEHSRVSALDRPGSLVGR